MMSVIISINIGVQLYARKQTWENMVEKFFLYMAGTNDFYIGRRGIQRGIGFLGFAGHWINKSPVSMKAAKASVDYGMDVDLDSGLSYERKNMAFLFATEDQKEGMRAFLEKRKPQFTGK